MKYVTDREDEMFEKKLKRVLKLLAIGTILILGLAGYAFAVPSISVFNSAPEVVLDLSGNGHTGTVVNSFLTTDGMSFDESTSKVNVNQTDIYGGETRTLIIWFKSFDASSSLDHIFYDGCNHGAGGVLYIKSGSRVRCRVKANGLVYNKTTYGFKTNEWFMTGYILDGTNCNTIINNQLSNSGAMTGVYNGSYMSVGGSYNNNALKGDIKQTRIYKRAISTTELTNLYLAGRSAPIDAISTNDLVLFYDFNTSPNPLTIDTHPIGVTP